MYVEVGHCFFSNDKFGVISLPVCLFSDITLLIGFHCTHSNVRGVPLIERFLLSYWSVLYKALLEKNQGAPLNERFILNGIFLTELYTRTVQQP